MGNINEKTSFIKTHDDPEACSNVSMPRLDIMYIKSTKSIEITAVGLCTAIRETALGTLEIYEKGDSIPLYSQMLTLHKDNSRTESQFQLRSPFKIMKNKHYALKVLVTGGPTYTYRDFCRYSTHRDVVIEVSRDPIPKMSASERASFSEAEVNSLVSLPLSRSKTTISTQISVSETDLDNPEPKIVKRKTNKKTTFQQPGSIEEIDDHFLRPPGKAERRVSKIETMPPARNDLIAKSRRSGPKSLNNLDKSTEKEPLAPTAQKAKNFRMNLITGISFRYSNIECCVSSK